MRQRAIFFSLMALFGAHDGLLAEGMTRDFFKDKPRSFIKDYYISQYLDQNITSQDAKALIGDVHNMNYPLFYKFVDKIDDFSFKRTKYCLELEASKFEGKSDDCIAMGLSGYKATTLDPKTLLRISQSVQEHYPNLSKKYALIAARSFESLMGADAPQIISVFNEVGNGFRETYFNRPLPPSTLDALSKLPAFGSMIENIVRNPNLDALQKSILKFDASAQSNETNFLLALNALRQGNEEVAAWYLKASHQKAWHQFDKDKALFWLYLATQDPQNLTKLTESKDINFYTLYAHEKLKLPHPKVLTSIEPKNPKAPFDVIDPFAWIKIENMLKAEKFPNDEAKKAAIMKLNAEESQPHVAYLLYKFERNEHYFFMPYFSYLAPLPKERAALILALARQESRFIPTAVSYSYALGLMQFMPYVAKDLAAKNGFENFSPEDLFDPKVAYRLADLHLNYLQNTLSHPLFIAYAYNGGAGFTKREILQKGYFQEGKYEPFMSMEIMPNAQAREYGKKVLANYVIYAQLLDVNTSIGALLDRLMSPSRTPRF